MPRYRITTELDYQVSTVIQIPCFLIVEAENEHSLPESFNKNDFTPTDDGQEELWEFGDYESCHSSRIKFYETVVEELDDCFNLEEVSSPDNYNPNQMKLFND